MNPVFRSMLVLVLALVLVALRGNLAHACSGTAYSPLVELADADTVVTVKITKSKTSEGAQQYELAVQEVVRGTFAPKIIVHVVDTMCTKPLDEKSPLVFAVRDGALVVPLVFSVPTSFALASAMARAKNDKARIVAMVAAVQAKVRVANHDASSIAEYLNSHPELGKAMTRQQKRVLRKAIVASAASGYRSDRKQWEIAVGS
ncbi:MAG: hypothetical protein KBG15_03265 [Kofleriaceae bacterium]|nr:hypothetical protein [Kofleriaceae bacterium]